MTARPAVVAGALSVVAALAGTGATSSTAAEGHLLSHLAAPGDRQAPIVARQASTAVGLGMREWSITLYRPKVRAGTLRFLVTNRGEDAHNLRVRGPNGYRSRVSADASPDGGRVTLTTRLRRPGRYVLVCVKPGHEKLGMRATLKVVAS